MPKLKGQQKKSYSRVIRAGGTVHCHHEAGGKTSYKLDNGNMLGPEMFRQLLDAGALVPNHDGLLPDDSQTFKAVP